MTKLVNLSINTQPHNQHARPKGPQYFNSFFATGAAFSISDQISMTAIKSIEDWWFSTSTAAEEAFKSSAPSMVNVMGTILLTYFSSLAVIDPLPGCLGVGRHSTQTRTLVAM